ncbi:MAG: bifunctional UDP-N-acetylglucosamine diphosphorylase/glucosamine-1-phosphate N-acetyltransferase GlmU [Nitrospirota bacterium]
MNLSVVILAAGRGKRMNSRKPKVLHEILGRPMLRYTIDAVKPLKPQKLIVVIGNGAEEVRNKIDDKDISFVIQKELLGTGDALAAAQKLLKNSEGAVLVLNGDCPLMTTKTLRELLKNHNRSKNALSLLSFIDDSLSGYGRIMRDKGKVTGIVEDKHATQEERKSKELNGGVYVLESDVMNHLKKISRNASSGEYYLTDIVNIVSNAGGRLNAYNCPPEEIIGVNSREDLYEVSKILNRRNISKLMEKGVTFVNPETSVVHSLVSIGRDSIIHPNTYLEGKTSIGYGCVIYHGTRIVGSALGNGVTVKDSSLIEESKVGSGAVIGPFAHLRPKSDIGRDVKIGNFVEIKSSRIGDRTKASHLTYLGDSEVGRDVNIGAGTITCNYDGEKKYKTVIESGVFIGSDSQLVAPVRIGRGSYVAAGSTVTQDVPSGALSISREKQKNLIGWVNKRQLRVKSLELRVKDKRRKK